MHRLFILFVLVFLFSCKKEKEKTLFVDFSPYKNVWVDNRLAPYVRNFIIDAAKRGVDVSDLGKLSAISIVDKIGNNFEGYYSRKNRVVVIDKSLLFKSEKYLRKVVYHELGHALDIPHTCEDCSDIMSSRPPFYLDMKKEFEEDWEYHVNRLFILIKYRNEKISGM